jgi:hypothetical protein
LASINKICEIIGSRTTGEQNMNRVVRTLVKEVKEAIPPTVFFLIAFHATAFTRALIEQSMGLTPEAATLATIGALIVGKTILIVDHLRVTNLFASRPLIFGILWKTLIFSVIATLFQGIEELVPLISKQGSVGAAVENLFSEVVWPRFWANRIVLLLFVLIYASAVELIRVFGAEPLKPLFFGIGQPEQPSPAPR